MTTDPALAAFQDRLGYTFRDEVLLRIALTHASREDSRDNERLEFLGDRVLGLVIAAYLYEHFPDAPEGELSRRFVALVRRETCAEVARAVDVGAVVRLARGEADTGGREKPAILADAMEAVIAAIYRDGGYPAAQAVVLAHWAPLADTLGTEAPQDAKTALQEWSQGRGLGTPAYRETGRSGPDHAPIFQVEVSVEKHGTATGEGPSKREAQRLAAVALLARVTGG